MDFVISDDLADIEAAIAPEYYGDSREESCDGQVVEQTGLLATARGLRAAFSRYPRRPGNLSRYGSASNRGWGAGWPDCNNGKMSVIVGGGVRVAVRKEIAPIIRVLLNYAETELKYSVKSGQTGGFACRPIGGTRTASNHSWGLAVDINWQANPMSSRFVCDLPPKLVKAFWSCGFYWGGWYNGGRFDPMHFEYTGRPSDVDRHLLIARSIVAASSSTTPTATAPAPSRTVVSLSKLKAAYEAEGTGEPDPDTKQLQARLNSRGYETGTPDGYYGERTRHAMTAYRAKKYDTFPGHPDTLGTPGRESLEDLGFKVVA